MNSWRQVGSGVVYALVSVVLVLGGLALAVAETGARARAPQPPTPSLIPVEPSETDAPLFPSPTVGLPPPATSSFFIFTATSPTVAIASPTATARVLPSSTRPLFYPSTAPCGPYAGWLKTHTVQPGDTLYHIASVYRTTVPALETANCRTSTIIYPGDLLWVPNVPTSTPGLTFIPSFATNTDVPTLTPEVLYATATETAAPSETPSPDP